MLFNFCQVPSARICFIEPEPKHDGHGCTDTDSRNKDVPPDGLWLAGKWLKRGQNADCNRVNNCQNDSGLELEPWRGRSASQHEAHRAHRRVGNCRYPDTGVEPSGADPEQHEKRNKKSPEIRSDRCGKNQNPSQGVFHMQSRTDTRFGRGGETFLRPTFAPPASVNYRYP